MEYKVRCSSLPTLLAGCGKVTGKYEWKDLAKMNDSHIALAISIYNKKEYGCESHSPGSLTMEAGNENERDAVLMYDKHFGTSYLELYDGTRALELPFERSNDFSTGSRDFGDNEKTIDAKGSTDKNVFDAKKFKPLELDYVIQMNGYGMLYRTPKLELYNYLGNATTGQIKSMLYQHSYTKMLSELEADRYQEYLERIFNYDHLPLEKRTHTIEVPVIKDFTEIIFTRVAALNRWIERNKYKL